MKSLLIAFALLQINTVFATTDAADSITPQQAVKEEQDSTPEAPLDYTSAGSRTRVKYQFALGWGTEYVDTPVTISAGYFLNPQNMLTLRYSNFNGANEVSDPIAANTLRAVTLGIRHFFGNSFNVTPTIYYRRNTSTSYDKKSTYNFFSSADDLKFEDVGVGIRLGNEWQWDHLAIGCDWFGLNRTVVLIHDERQNPGILDSISLKRKLTLTLLSFYIGLSF